MFGTSLPDRFVFGKRLKELMKKSGIKQIDLANLINIDRSRLSHYINGRYEPDIAVLASISKVLNTSIDYLIGMTNTMALAGFKNIEKNFSSIVWQKERPESPSDQGIITWLPVYESRSSLIQGQEIGGEDDDPDIEDKVQPVGWVRGWMKVHNSSGWDYHYMLVATDDTMAPYIIKGDMLCIEELEIEDYASYKFRKGGVYITKRSDKDYIGLTLKMCNVNNDNLILTTTSPDDPPLVYNISTLDFQPVVGRISTIIRRPFN